MCLELVILNLRSCLLVLRCTRMTTYAPVSKRETRFLLADRVRTGSGSLLLVSGEQAISEVHLMFA